MQRVKVFLIGGAPGAGKTTLGRALAARLGIASVTVDDLMTVAQAVTRPETHPDLHVMRKVSHLEYFTDSSVEQLKVDADVQHEASWLFIQRLILKYASSGSSGIVIDGWHLRPDRVAELNVSGVWAGWLVVSPSVLIERERGNVAWLQGSSDPEGMLENFLARSLWFNALIQQQASALGMRVLFQDGGSSVDDLCSLILEELND